MSLEIRDAAHGDAAVLALLGRLTFCETFRHLFARHPDDLAAYLEAIFDYELMSRPSAAPIAQAAQGGGNPDRGVRGV